MKSFAAYAYVITGFPGLDAGSHVTALRDLLVSTGNFYGRIMDEEP